MKSIQKTLSLLLAIMIALIPFGTAAAESSKTAFDRVALTLTNVSSTYLGWTGEQSGSIRASLGASSDGPRALGTVSFLPDGRESVSMTASVENGQLRVVLPELPHGAVASTSYAVNWLVWQDQLPLKDEPHAKASPLRENLEYFFDSLNGGLTFRTLQPGDFLYDESLWRDYWEKAAQRPFMTYEGEEEITLSGRSYTARKYAIDTGELSFFEYMNFLQAIQRPSEALFSNADFPLPMALSSIPEDSFEGLTLHVTGDDHRYLYQGTLYLVDEVMGIVESASLTTRTPDGETVETLEYSDLFEDGSVRMEGQTVVFRDQFKVTTQESVVLRKTPSGSTDFRYTSDLYQFFRPEEGNAVIQVDRAEHSFSFTDQRLTFDSNTSSEESNLPDQRSSFSLTLEADPSGDPRASGSVSYRSADGVQETSFDADLDAEFDFLPAGELLPPDEEAIFLFTNDRKSEDLVQSAVYSFLWRIRSFPIPGLLEDLESLPGIMSGS